MIDNKKCGVFSSPVAIFCCNQQKQTFLELKDTSEKEVSIIAKFKVI